MKTSLLAVALLLALPPAVEAYPTTKVVNHGRLQVLQIFDLTSTNNLNILEGEATNGIPSATFPLDAAWEKLRVFTFVTFAANTYVTVKVECSLDNTTYAVVQTRAIEAGVATLSDLSDRKALGGASKNFMTEYDVRGCVSAKITLGGDNTDVANVQAVAVR